MNYSDFLKQKTSIMRGEGIEANNLNKNLFDFQAEIVTRSLRNMRFANFSDTGLGKTIMQLEYGKQVASQRNVAVLILTPLAVARQTIEQGEQFGIEVNRLNGNVSKGGMYIVNYDQLDNVDCSKFDCIILDESSCLKHYDSKTRKKLTQFFASTPYKLCCTATPSPNDPMELGNHSEFLNVMSRNEMLAMYFIHDGGDTAKWRIKKHGVKAFYSFVCQWGVVVTKPSDLGFDNKRFILPSLNIKEHRITTENTGETLFNDLAVSATNFNKTLRDTISDRLTKAAELVTDEPVCIWVKQDAEADYLKKLLPNAIEVRGSQSTEEKEEKLLGFAKNEFQILITKPKIAQYGLNLQKVHNTIFPSPDFSFESSYQCIRRFYRYGQEHEVNVHILSTDRMQNVTQSLKQKESQWKEMVNQMVAVQTTEMGMQ